MVNQSEDALVRSEYNALEALVRWDEIGSISAEAQSRLRATAKTFRNYRGAECGLVRNLGRMSQDVVLENNQLACIYKLNAERIAHLSQITADLPKR